ncbi:hypothetical protein [Pseudomonas sp. B392_1p]|uniref:hypothetical protein n=1 Tax=Pseudomonas sp. B392_1p TaxID=3457507 RepID=UPI003FD15FF4
MTPAFVPSIVDDQLGDLTCYDIHEAVGETPRQAIKAAEGLGLYGWPRSVSREDRKGRMLWVHRYERPTEVRHA